jgi:ELWxxDGT repeat protein
MMRSGPAKILLSLLLATVPVRAAEVPHLLADVNQTPGPSFAPPLAQPSGFFSLGGRSLFSTSGSGDEGMLWSTDGTAEGTRVVSSTICPYPCQGIKLLGVWQGAAILDVVTGPASGPIASAVWRTDGTTAGTFQLAGPFLNFSSTLTAIYPLGDRFFFFVSCDLSLNCSLFRSDGTRAGTAPFMAAGITSSFANPHSFAVWRDRLVFISFTDFSTSEGLWSTDGTPEGTVRLADVQEVQDSLAPVVPTPSHLFFASGETGEDLWVTDGTPGNARRLADFDPVQCARFPEPFCNTPDINTLTAIGDGVLFITHRTGHGQEIWRSDGTESGTRPVIELPSPESWSVPEPLPGGRWLFAGSPTGTGEGLKLWTADADFTHAAPLTGCDGGACPGFAGFLSPTLPHLFVGRDDAHGTEVWITDGTGAGTHLLADVCPGPCSGYRFQVGRETVLGMAAGRTWFLAFPHDGDQNSVDDEIWVTDGTPAGTHRALGHVPGDLGFLGDLALYGISGPNRDTAELWATNGTPAGTRQVTVLQRAAPGSFPAFWPLANGVLLKVYDGTHDVLWQSDGTAGRTVSLFELPGGRSFVGEATRVGDLQFFLVATADRTEIWRTAGTAPGTFRVNRVALGAGVSLMTSWRGRLLFLVEGETCAFWSSDGTPGGTRAILPQLPFLDCPTTVQAAGARFLFVAPLPRGGRSVPQIFVSDGTAAGTRQISQIRYTRPSSGDDPVTAGGITFFRIYLPIGTDVQVWRTDGTGAGTYLAFNAVQPADLFGFRGSLYFTARLPDSTVTRILYRVPASGGEPIPLAEFDTSFNPFALPEFTPAGDRLFFVAPSGIGTELWTTDGTPAGTRRVSSIGSRPSSLKDLVAAGNRVFFSADDGEHGRELWESDGTEEGTRMVFDLNPGGFSSNPANLTVSGGYLFFSADDGETGVEPWALRLDP